MRHRLRNLAANALGVEENPELQQAPDDPAPATAAVQAATPDRLLAPHASAPVTVIGRTQSRVVSVPAPVAVREPQAEITDLRAVAVILIGLVLAILMMASITHR